MQSRGIQMLGLLLACLTWMLAGCAGPAKITAAPDIFRVCHERIDLAGRFSVRYLRDGEEHAMHGSFNWIQYDNHSELTLLSPLGQMVAKLEVAPKVTVLTLSDKDVRVAANPDVLAREALGWPLPVSGMRDWMQGCAQEIGGKRFVATPVNRRVKTQGGWQLVYPVWVASALEQVRPKRIDMQHHEGDDDVSLRVVIDTWKPHE